MRKLIFFFTENHHYRKCHGFILVSTNNINDYVSEIVANRNLYNISQIPFVLTFSKCDLLKSEYGYSDYAYSSYDCYEAIELKIRYRIKTSAKQGIGINEAFEKVINQIVMKMYWDSEEKSKALVPASEKKKCELM